MRCKFVSAMPRSDALDRTSDKFTELMRGGVVISAMVSAPCSAKTRASTADASSRISLTHCFCAPLLEEFLEHAFAVFLGDERANPRSRGRDALFEGPFMLPGAACPTCLHRHFIKLL